MELSHHELELTVGESIQIGDKLITAIDTPEHGVAILIESIPIDDDFDVMSGVDFESEQESSASISRPR